MWDRWQKGESLNSIARLFDRHHSGVAARDFEQTDLAHIRSTGVNQIVSIAVIVSDSINVKTNYFLNAPLI